jgi:hypothetical protein
LAGKEPFIDALLAHRAVQKLLSMYLDKMGRRTLHPSFDVLKNTGRTSSFGDINAQNLPRDDRVRTCFAAPRDHVFVDADYAMIELVTLAQAAIRQFDLRSKMAEAINDGADLHRLVASHVARKPLAEVTRDERQKAKPINFGKPDGMGHRGLMGYAKASYGVNLTSEDITTLTETWFVDELSAKLVRAARAVARKVHRPEFEEQGFDAELVAVALEPLRIDLGLIWRWRIRQTGGNRPNSVSGIPGRPRRPPAPAEGPIWRFARRFIGRRWGSAVHLLSGSLSICKAACALPDKRRRGAGRAAGAPLRAGGLKHPALKLRRHLGQRATKVPCSAPLRFGDLSQSECCSGRTVTARTKVSHRPNPCVAPVAAVTRAIDSRFWFPWHCSHGFAIIGSPAGAQSTNAWKPPR